MDKVTRIDDQMNSEDGEIDLSKAFRFISLADNQSKLRGADWLIKPFLERNITSVMFGESGLYKSFIALDLGLCVAYGQEYHGHRVHQGAVYYLCGEGKGGIARRVEAWRLEHGLQHKDAPFYVSEIPAQLLDEGSAQDVAFAMEKPALVIIDTLSTNIGEGDENSNADVGRMLVHVGRYIRDAHSACALFVHHVGHGDKGRERGAYALRGNADTRIQVKPYKGGCSLHSLKVKDGAPFQTIAFEPQTVVIPGIVDSEGDLVTSLTMGQIEYTEPTTVKTLPPQQLKALTVLQTMGPSLAIDWKNELIKQQIIKQDRRYFSKVKNALFQAKLAREKDGLCQIVDLTEDE